jgi:hypothetical protein
MRERKPGGTFCRSEGGGSLKALPLEMCIGATRPDTILGSTTVIVPTRATKVTTESTIAA